MHSYRKQMFFMMFLMMLFVFLGLFVISFNMEKVTLREGHDFLALIPQEKGLWEVRFLGASVLINTEAISQAISKVLTEQLDKVDRVGSQVKQQITQYASSGYGYLEKALSFVKEQLSLLKQYLKCTE